MLAGLLFAVRDAEDRPDRLAATLPFAGTTVIEYQARLLLAAGAAQIVVVVTRLTPDLLGAISRIGRRGIAVDAVRSVGEAAEKLHPLARVLIVADGLITGEGTIRLLAGEGSDALLVIGEGEADAAFERIGGRMAWAGIARLAPTRLREVAAMPRDYDPQSALLRVAAQVGAAHLLLPPGANAEGHGVARRASALDVQGRAVAAAAMTARQGWFDRLIVAPIGRLALPLLVSRGVPAGFVALGGVALGLGGLAAAYFDLFATGLTLVLAGVIAASIGSALADLRDEPRLAKALDGASVFLPLVAALLVAWRTDLTSGGTTATVVAVALAGFAGLAERAMPGRKRRPPWGSPGAYLIVLLAGAIAGAPPIGLVAAGIYAAITAAAAVEALRQKA
jgi:hypothetical protein